MPAPTVFRRFHRPTLRLASSPLGIFSIRLGHIIRGWIYCCIGALTIGLAWGWSQLNPSQYEALYLLNFLPGSRLLLTLTIIGLGGYLLWILTRIFSPGPIILRIGQVFSLFPYLALIWLILLFLFGIFPSPHSMSFYVQSLITYPSGRWLVIAASLILSLAGLAQILLSLFHTPAHRFLFRSGLHPRHQQALYLLARLGLVGRGSVLTFIGLFLLHAAWEATQYASVGTEEVLKNLAYRQYGIPFATLLGLGLIFYGLYSFVLAWWLDWPSSK